MCDHFSRTGFGAQLLGSFDGGRGRVDEYIVGRTLTPFDVEDPGIRAEVAQAFAHFHAMRLPCDKSRKAKSQQVMFEIFSEESLRGTREALGSAGSELEALLKHDLAGDLKRVIAKLEDMGAKRCWCAVDTQVSQTHAVLTITVSTNACL